MGKKALIVVDVQNDFCPGGTLPVKEGDKTVPALNMYMDFFSSAGLPVYATRDWHPSVTRHFAEYGGVWPAHCVQGTKGAEFHPALKLPEETVIITKGERPEEDSYSGFDGRGPSGKGLKDSLKDASVDHIYIGGLATDYCVKQTVIDGLKEGFDVTVLTDAVKGVDVKAGDSERALDEMKALGADTVTIDDLKMRIARAGK